MQTKLKKLGVKTTLTKKNNFNSDGSYSRFAKFSKVHTSINFCTCSKCCIDRFQNEQKTHRNAPLSNYLNSDNTNTCLNLQKSFVGAVNRSFTSKPVYSYGK